jgi:Spy/CpxP family protein refolding chaperone
MHPHIIAWWARARRGESVCHPGGGGWAGSHGDYSRAGWQQAAHSHDGGAFGVRRPLRFLSHRLDLTDKQAATLARILDELKTERAQNEVDERRTASAFAAVFEHPEFDESTAAAAADGRVESAKRLRNAVLRALAQIHALLNPEQRETFAYLLRTGVLNI